MLASSVCIISDGQESPQRRDSDSTDRARASASSKRRWKYATQARRPAAQLTPPRSPSSSKISSASSSSLLGVGEIARLEGDPRQPLMRPGVAAGVVDVVVDLHRLVEVGAGRRQRTAEALGEPALAQRMGEPAAARRARRRQPSPRRARVAPTAGRPACGRSCRCDGAPRPRAPRWRSASALSRTRSASDVGLGECPTARFRRCTGRGAAHAR